MRPTPRRPTRASAIRGPGCRSASPRCSPSSRR
jgi:hypothetical protein